MSEARGRARRALLGLVDSVSLSEPFASSIALFADEQRESLASRLLEHWGTRSPGSPVGPDRYRWELTHARATGIPEYAGDPATWTAWKPAEQTFLTQDPFAFEERLSVPIVSTETAELLALLADSERLAGPAAEMLHEAAPVLRRDFASYIQARHSWTDTFGLWCVVRHPRTLAMLHPMAFAIGECYAATARRTDGTVLGSRFPFHDKPLVSASAQLASGLLALGADVDLVVALFNHVESSRGPDGAWGDADGPSDVMTTLVAADLLAHADPAFDPAPTVKWLIQRQCADGFWKALGPEAPWSTREVLGLLEAAAKPFASRFRWPHVQAANLDHKTLLPSYAYFSEVASLFRELPGLSAASTELGFIDLAGFRDFNNQFGQDQGDAVLACFARELARVDGVRAIRDGGDEFLVVGAPTGSGLVPALDAFRKSWPKRFEAEFGEGVTPVAPRVLVTEVAGRQLVRAREELGRAVAPLKKREPAPSPEGVLSRVKLG